MATFAQKAAEIYDRAVRAVMARDSIPYGPAVLKLNQEDPEFYNVYRMAQRGPLAGMQYPQTKGGK